MVWQDGQLSWHDEPVDLDLPSVVSAGAHRDITADHDRFEAVADQVFGPPEHRAWTPPPPGAATLRHPPLAASKVPTACLSDQIVKAYDIRGTVPISSTPAWPGPSASPSPASPRRRRILVGRDMRPSGVELVAVFADGVMSQGVDVVDLGLASTDLLYYAAGRLDAPGAMFTASHNPAQYNGIKLCLAGAKPVGADTGLADIKAIAAAVLDGAGPPAAAPRRRPTATCSTTSPTTSCPSSTLGRAAQGRGRHGQRHGRSGGARRCSSACPGRARGDVRRLDGTFPNHPADPIQPANQLDLQARVVSGGFDLGLAFDGDADRVFVVDEAGRGLSGSTTTALLAAGMLAKHPARRSCTT